MSINVTIDCDTCKTSVVEPPTVTRLAGALRAKGWKINTRSRQVACPSCAKAGAVVEAEAEAEVKAKAK